MQKLKRPDRQRQRKATHARRKAKYRGTPRRDGLGWLRRDETLHVITHTKAVQAENAEVVKEEKGEDVTLQLD